MPGEFISPEQIKKGGPQKMEHFMGQRNDPCPCGSGLKWKKCTCAEYHSEGNGQG